MITGIILGLLFMASIAAAYIHGAMIAVKIAIERASEIIEEIRPHKNHTLFAADLTRRIPDMARDSAVNNEALILNLLKELEL